MIQKDAQSFSFLPSKDQFQGLEIGDGILKGAQTAQWYRDYSTSNQEIFQFPAGVRLSLVQSIQNSYWPNQPLCSGARSKDLEADHSPPYSTKVNNKRYFTFTTPHMHME